MTAATIRASATYRARRKAELARYREALEEIANMLNDTDKSDALWALDVARVALQGDK